VVNELPRKPKKKISDRLTISLGPGQREALQAIAETNRTSLAFVLRYALERFIAENQDKQLPLAFPNNQKGI
jgi:hypothetical protein